MARRSYTFIAALGLAWMLAQAVFAPFAADAPRPAFYWLIGANIVQTAIVAALMLWLSVLATRHQRMDEPPRERKPVVYTAHEANAPDRRVGAAPAVDSEGVPYRGRKTDREGLARVRDKFEQELATELDAVSKVNEEDAD